MQQVAFFDLDNTMVHGSSLFHVARRLVSDGLLSRRRVAGFAFMEARFVIARTESRCDRARITGEALQLVSGRTADEVSRVCDSAAERLIATRTVRATVEALRRHQAVGAETWLVTASPIELAGSVARLLGMTGALATVPEIVDGRYTGRLRSGLMHGARKADAIRELAATRSLDLANGYAYSDSENDLPMLSLTGHAAVVNANRRLRSLARMRGWEILRIGPVPCDAVASAEEETQESWDDQIIPPFPQHLLLFSA